MIPLFLGSVFAALFEKLRDTPAVNDRDSSLAWLLQPPGSPLPLALVGLEHGHTERHGISYYRGPHGSSRFILSTSGVPVAGLLVVGRPGGYQVRGIYVHQDVRRNQVASVLFREAQEILGEPIGHSDTRTAIGDEWVRSLSPPAEERSLEPQERSLESQISDILAANPVLSEPGFEDAILLSNLRMAIADDLGLRGLQQLPLLAFLNGEGPLPAEFTPAGLVQSAVAVLSSPPRWMEYSLRELDHNQRMALLPHIFPVQV